MGPEAAAPAGAVVEPGALPTWSAPVVTPWVHDVDWNLKCLDLAPRQLLGVAVLVLDGKEVLLVTIRILLTRNPPCHSTTKEACTWKVLAEGDANPHGIDHHGSSTSLRPP